jgi:hypothetical protein
MTDGLAVTWTVSPGGAVVVVPCAPVVEVEGARVVRVVVCVVVGVV